MKYSHIKIYVKFVIQQYFSIDHFYLYLFYINVKDDDRVKGIIRFLIDTQYGKLSFATSVVLV